jgi:hypothetical protein
MITSTPELTDRIVTSTSGASGIRKATATLVIAVGPSTN